MNIKTIIDKFDKKFPKVIYDKDATYIPYYEQYPKLKQFLKDSLTSMLDGIKDNLPNTTNSNIVGRDREIYDLGATDYKKEVINIINLLK